MANYEAKLFSDGKKEQREYSPSIFGVYHQLTYLPQTLSFLETLRLEGKRVMLELSDYPIPKKYRMINPDFCEFFDAVAQLIIKSGGIVIAGDSEELLNEAAKELDILWAKSPSTYLCERIRIVSKKREPYFLNFIQENRPDLVILDYGHAEYVANGLKQNFSIID